MTPEQRTNFYDSLKVHQLRMGGIVGFSQLVTLTSSENGYLSYPVHGVLTINEQGVNGSVINSVFRRLLPDGSLGAPVVAKRPVFTHHDEGVPGDAPLPRMNDRTHEALVWAERFIAGFEGDELQEGVDVILGRLRTLIRENPRTT